MFNILLNLQHNWKYLAHEEEIDESPKESKGNGSPRKKSLANQLGLHTLSTSLQDQAEPFYRVCVILGGH